MPLSERAKKLGQEPAFPYAIEHGTEAWNGGMTKREYIAVKAYSGLLDNPADCRLEHVAASAIRYADALLEALAKDGG